MSTFKFFRKDRKIQIILITEDEFLGVIKESLRSLKTNIIRFLVPLLVQTEKTQWNFISNRY